MRSLLKENATLIQLFAKLLDWLVIVLTGFGLYFYKFGTYSVMPHYVITILAISFLASGLFHYQKIYQPLRGRPYRYILSMITISWSVSIGVLILYTFMFKTGVRYSREWVSLWFFVALGCLWVERSFVYYGLRYARAQGYNLRHILVVGEGELLERVLATLSASKWSGYAVNQKVAVGELLASQALQQKVLEITESNSIDEVWLAVPMEQAKDLKQVMSLLKHSTCVVRLVPDIFGMHLINYSVEDVVGLPVVNLRATPMTESNQIIKWVEDKLIASIILILISPILLVVAVAVKLSSPGPVFFRQERVSWNNKTFNMLKFRSMPVDVESKSGAVWAKPGEQRATKVGAFLRKTSLDELPQFINVLKGDMSIVGPRPERPVFVDQFKEEIPGYMQKHMVKAGITGWAQVNGWRGDTDLKKRIEYDLYYIENWSLWFDLRIILMTIFKGFVNKNAY